MGKTGQGKLELKHQHKTIDGWKRYNKMLFAAVRGDRGEPEQSLKKRNKTCTTGRKAEHPRQVGKTPLHREGPSRVEGKRRESVSGPVRLRKKIERGGGKGLG